VTLINL